MHCVYRRDTFAADLIEDLLCVHPAAQGAADEPPFRISAQGHAQWTLVGEVDLAGARAFRAATAAIVEPHADVTIDVSGLDFIGIDALRTLAHSTARASATLHLIGATDHLRRIWRLSEFDVVAPTVRFAGQETGVGSVAT